MKKFRVVILSLRQKISTALLLPLSINVLSVWAVSHELIVPVINWQQTPAQVLAEQPLKLVEQQPTRLTYETELLAKPFHQEFLFSADGLLQNVLFYRAYQQSETDCLSEFNQVRATIEMQLGEGVNQGAEQRQNADDLCQQVAEGKIYLETSWQQANQLNTLQLSTWKGQAYLGLSLTQIPQPN